MSSNPPGVDNNQYDVTYQVAFEKEMLDMAPGPKKTSVLMLSWGNEPGTDLDTAAEVQHLKRVFKESYGFRVTEETLTAKKPRSTINHLVSNFVYHEDEVNNLLIIYYAGHGDMSAVDDGKLLLARGNSLDARKENNTIIWDTVEHLIKDCEADILLIFDCCCAGQAARARGRGLTSRKVYEVLAACQSDERTPAPGEGSFTSALIRALEELATEKQGFPISELYGKILSAPVYKRHRHYEDSEPTPHPFWAEKEGTHCFRKIIMAPLGVQINTELEDIPGANYALQLNMLFSGQPRNEDIPILCRKLKELIKSDEIAVSPHQVEYGGLFTPTALEAHRKGLARATIWKWKDVARKSRQRNQEVEVAMASPPFPLTPRTDHQGAVQMMTPDSAIPSKRRRRDEDQYSSHEGSPA